MGEESYNLFTELRKGLSRKTTELVDWRDPCPFRSDEDRIAQTSYHISAFCRHLCDTVFFADLYVRWADKLSDSPVPIYDSWLTMHFNNYFVPKVSPCPKDIIAFYQNSDKTRYISVFEPIKDNDEDNPDNWIRKSVIISDRPKFLINYDWVDEPESEGRFALMQDFAANAKALFALFKGLPEREAKQLDNLVDRIKAFENDNLAI
jgi:hypothetical protein